MKKVIIFGTSTFAEVAYEYFKKEKTVNIVAFSANKKFIKERKFLGLPLVPFEKIEEEFSPKKYSMFIATSYQNMNKTREKIFKQAKIKGYELVSYVDKNASKWKDVKIGENCFIFENNVIQPFVKIGNNVIMWSGNHIGHGVEIEDNCFISSHVVIAGFSKIGKNSFLGINSSIRDGIRIGKECIIGAGSVILNNTKDKEVYSSGNTKRLSMQSNKVKRI